MNGGGSVQDPFGLKPASVPAGFPGRVAFLKSARGLAGAPNLPLPEICFCGRSNVGKSSLINTLVGRRQIARVSRVPGRTRLINFFNVQDVLCLVDLPGYGWAKVSRAMQAEWGQTIETYLDGRPQLCLAMLLVDIRRDPGHEERDLLHWLQDRQGRLCLIVATKADKISPSRRPARLAAIAKALGVPRRDVITFSATTRQGREQLWGITLRIAARGTGADTA